MKSTNGHPTRAQLIAAARSGRVPFRAHLEKCEVCREQLELFRSLDLVGDSGLKQPTQEAIERWTRVPLLDEPKRPRRERIGAIGFDSWRERPAAVRDIPDGLVRRLRLKAQGLVLEVVGEQRRRVWHFIARVYRDRGVVDSYALKVGRHRLLPADDGFYTWSMTKPPKKISLLSPDEQVRFETLSW